MDCIDEGLIQMYIDGEASSKEVVEIEQHLKGCQSCTHKVIEQKKLVGELKLALNLLADEGMKNDDVEVDDKKSKFSLKRLVFIVSAASVVLIAIAFFKSRDPAQIPMQPIHYSLEWEVDANRPITDQDFTISIIDSDGNATELLMN